MKFDQFWVLLLAVMLISIATPPIARAVINFATPDSKK